MKIGEILANVINEFSSQTENPDIYGNQSLIVTIDPKYKDIICFLLHMGKNTLESPYHEIQTDILYDGPFQYRLDGPQDKITLTAKEHFFRHNGNLKTFFSKLVPAINVLVKELSESWLENDCGFENPAIWGTYYVFMMEQLAINLRFNTLEEKRLSFTTWLPNSQGRDLANKIYIYGNKDVCTKFINSICSELSLDSQYFFNKISSIGSRFTLTKSTNGTSLEIANLTSPGSIDIKVTNYPSRNMFIHEVTLDNLRVANIQVGDQIDVNISDSNSVTTRKQF